MKDIQTSIAELEKELVKQRLAIQDEIFNLKLKLKYSLLSPQAFTLAFFTGWGISKRLLKKRIAASSNLPVKKSRLFTKLAGLWVLIKRIPLPWVRRTTHWLIH